MNIPLSMFVLIVLLVLAAFFAGAEVALVSLSRVRVRTLVKQGTQNAQALKRLKAKPSRMIITILIGNNVVNVATSTLVTVIVTNLFGSAAVGVAAGILTLFLLVFGEILPKTYAQAHADRFALFAARPLELLGIALLPLIVALEWLAKAVQQHEGAKRGLTEAEIKSMVEFGVESNVLEPEEQAIINKAMRFSDTVTAQVMTPLKEVFALEAGTSVHNAAQQMVAKRFSRAPVYQKDTQNIIGIAIFSAMVAGVQGGRGETPLGEVAHKPLFVSGNLGIDDTFKKMTKGRIHMALVRDTKKRIVGLVTLEDLLEELVGEIDDEKMTHKRV